MLGHLGNKVLLVGDCTLENVFFQYYLAPLCSIQLINHSSKQSVEMRGASRMAVDSDPRPRCSGRMLEGKK